MGTTADYASLILTPLLRKWTESYKDGSWMRLPKWSPIQVLDVEEVAEKQAGEQKLYAQQALSKLGKEES